MAFTINHATKVISIPKADTTFVETNATTGYEIRSFDEYQFMRDLGDYLDSEDGVSLPDAFSHNTTVTISGIIYARSISFLAPYTITFENGTYQVKLVGGSNNNLLDVLNPNSVSVIPANSAGLQTVVSGSGVTAQDKLDIADEVRVELAAELAAILDARKLLRNKRVLDPTTGIETIYDDNGAVLYTRNVYENSTGTQPYRGQGAERVERYT